MLKKIYRAILAALLLGFVGTPLLVLTAYAFSGEWNYPALWPTRWTLESFEYILNYENALSSLWLSLRVACVTTVLALAIGAPAGYAMSRYEFRAKSVAQTLLFARTAVPVVVLGVGTASVFISMGLTDTFFGIVLAHLVGALPMMVWTTKAGFAGVQPSFEEAARDCGAGPLRAFASITVPMAKTSLIAGAILVFVFSMDEFTITLLISGANYTTLPLRLYSTLQQGYIEPASASAILLLVPSVVMLFLLMRFSKLTDVASSAGK